MKKGFGWNLFQTHIIPALVSFFTLSGFFFKLWVCFKVPCPKNEKISISFPNVEFYTESFEKKSIKLKSRSSPDSAHDHQHPYKFFLVLPISKHFWTL